MNADQVYENIDEDSEDYGCPKCGCCIFVDIDYTELGEDGKNDDERKLKCEECGEIVE